MIEIFNKYIKMSFWPLMGGYAIYVLYILYSYYDGLKYVVNKEFYDNLVLEKMIYVGVIVAAGAVFKIWKKTRIANLILGVPALIIIFEFLIIMGVWLFLALAFIIFGK